jgi:hypothetical protein
MFWFPRDCPRGCIWPVSATTPEDAYRLPAEMFRPHEVGGYWVADEQVEAIGQVVVDDLLGRH